MGRRTKLTLQMKAVQELLNSLSQKDKEHLLPALELIIKKVDGYTFYVEKCDGTLYFTCGEREGGQKRPFYAVFVTIESNSSGRGYAISLNVYSQADSDGCAIEWNHPKGSGWSVSYPFSALDETRRFRSLQERMHGLHGNRESRLGSIMAGQLMDCMLRAAAR